MTSVKNVKLKTNNDKFEVALIVIRNIGDIILVIFKFAEKFIL